MYFYYQNNMNINTNINSNNHGYGCTCKLADDISDFEKLKTLGEGGFSIVYLVRHLKNKKTYALKCMNKIKKGKNGEKKDRSSMIYHEIDILSKLNHPNVIRLFDWFEDKDKIYLVMEFVNGKDLGYYFDRELPDEKHAIHIIKQISEAIKYCHDNGIIHRDIKSSNILIDKDLNIKLTDFGLSAIKSHPLDTFFGYAGTAYFISPELLSKTGYNEKVDIWALGVTIYFLLTGEYPFKGKKRKDLFKKIKNDTINFENYILKEDQINLLKNLLNKNPNERFNIDEIIKHPWLNKK